MVRLYKADTLLVAHRIETRTKSKHDTDKAGMPTRKKWKQRSRALLALLALAALLVGHTAEAAHFERFQEARGSCPYPRQKCVLSELGKPICAPHPNWLDGLEPHNCIRFSNADMPSTMTSTFLIVYSDYHDRFIFTSGTATYQYVFVSTDGHGTQWNAVTVNSIARRFIPIAIPQSPRVIFLASTTTACGRYTDDFVTFTDITCPATTANVELYYNYVYIAERNRIIVSAFTNGLYISDNMGAGFTRHSIATVYGVAYSPALKIAVVAAASSGGYIRYSTDYGDTWTGATITSTQNMLSIAWSPNLKIFAACASGSQACQYSSDGITWTNGIAKGFTWGNSKINTKWVHSLQIFFAMESGLTTATYIYSPDGINWFRRIIGTAQWYRGRTFAENTRTGAFAFVSTDSSTNNIAVCNVGGGYMPCGVVAANDRSMCNKRADVDDVFNANSYVATSPGNNKNGVYYVEYLDAWIIMTPRTTARPQISFNEMTSWTEIMTNYSMTEATQYRPYSIIAMNDIQRIFAPVYGLTCGLMSYNGIDWWIVAGCTTTFNGTWWFEGVWMADRRRILLFEPMVRVLTPSTYVPKIIYSDNLGGTWTNTGFSNFWEGGGYRGGLLQTALYEPSHQILVSSGNNGIPYYSTTFGVTWTEATRVSRVTWDPWGNPGINGATTTPMRYTCAYSSISRIFVCQGRVLAYSYDGKTFTSAAAYPSLSWGVWYTPVHDLFYGVQSTANNGAGYTSDNRVLQVSHTGIEWYSSQPRNFSGANWFIHAGSSAVSTRTGRIAITTFGWTSPYSVNFLVMVPRKRPACGPDESDWRICDAEGATCRGGYCVSSSHDDVIVPYTNAAVTRSEVVAPAHTSAIKWIDERRAYEMHPVGGTNGSRNYFFRFNETTRQVVSTQDESMYDTAQTLEIMRSIYIPTHALFMHTYSATATTRLVKNVLHDLGDEPLTHVKVATAMTENIHAELGIDVNHIVYGAYLDMTAVITTNNELGIMQGHRGVLNVFPAPYSGASPNGYYFLVYSPTAKTFIAGLFSTRTLFLADGVNLHIVSTSYRGAVCIDEWMIGLWTEYDCFLFTTTALHGYKRVGNEHTLTTLKTGLTSATTRAMILPRAGGDILRTLSTGALHVVDSTGAGATITVTGQTWTDQFRVTPNGYDMQTGTVVMPGVSTTWQAVPNSPFQAMCRPVEETQFGYCDNGGICDEESSTCTNPSCMLEKVSHRTHATTANCRGSRRFYAYSDVDDLVVIATGRAFQDPDVETTSCDSSVFGHNHQQGMSYVYFIPHLALWFSRSLDDIPEQTTRDWATPLVINLDYVWQTGAGPNVTVLQGHAHKSCSEHHGICVSTRGQILGSFSGRTSATVMPPSFTWSRNGYIFRSPGDITPTLTGSIADVTTDAQGARIAYSPYLRRWVTLFHSPTWIGFSDDGKTWTATYNGHPNIFGSHQFGPNYIYMQIIWNPDLLEFAFYSAGGLYTSKDGIAWGRTYSSQFAADFNNYDVMYGGSITWIKLLWAYLIGPNRYGSVSPQNPHSHLIFTRTGKDRQLVDIVQGGTTFRQNYGSLWLRESRLVIVTSHHEGGTSSGLETPRLTFLKPTCPIEACKVSPVRWTSTKSRCQIDITLDYARHDYLIEDEVLWAHTKRRLDVTCITGASVPDPMTTCGEAFGLRVPCVPGRIIKDRRIQYVNMTTSELWMCGGVTNTSTMPACDSNACPIHGSRNVSMSLMSHLHSTHSYLTRTCNRTWDVDHSTKMSCNSGCSAPTTPTGFSTCSVDVHFGQWGRVVRTICDTPTGASAWPSGCGTIFPNASVTCVAGQRAQVTAYSGDVYMPIFAECRGTTTGSWQYSTCTGTAGYLQGFRNASKVDSYQRVFSHPLVFGQTPYRCTRTYVREPCTTSAPSPCTVTDWSSYSTCSHDCYGIAFRTRTVVLPAVNGGTACPALIEWTTCFVDKSFCGTATNNLIADMVVLPTHAYTKCAARVELVSHNVSDSTPFYKRTIVTCRKGDTSAISISDCGDGKGMHVDCNTGAGQSILAIVAANPSNYSVTCNAAHAKVPGSPPRTYNQTTSCAASSCVWLGVQANEYFHITETGGWPHPTLCRGELAHTQCNSTADCNCEVSAWSDWGACSESCGWGTWTRTRTITTHPFNGGTACPALSEDDDCFLECCPVDCEVGAWGEWSECDQECGNGTRWRSREITVNMTCDGQECPALNETESCNEACCLTEWTDWTACSLGCGNGTRSRTREFTGSNCDEEPDPMPDLEETERCNEECCLSEWSGWGACSLGCGNGTQTRTREVIEEHCTPPSEPELEQTQRCNEECCLSEWSGWGACSLECGNGTQTRTREVVEEHCDPPADPELEQTQHCNEHCCLSDWEEWSACSLECGNGTRTRVREFVGSACHETPDPMPHLEETEQCNEVCCLSAWGDWGACTLGCGNGTQAREREVVGTHCEAPVDPVLYETQRCNEECCLTNWVEWSECSLGCGNGTRWRDREVIEEHCDPPDSPELYQEERCNEECCLTDWTGWGGCSLECGNGTQTRTREVVEEHCTPPSEPELEQTQQCNEICCLSDWEEWSECSLSCGNGTQAREREVVGDHCTAPVDPVLYETQRCNEECCIAEWSAWSTCSLGCGNGTQWRDREVIEEHCTPPDSPVLYETQRCNEECCLSAWSGWSACNQTCGNGTQWRDRSVVDEHCTPPDDPVLYEWQPCNLVCCITEWSAWTECPVACGGGTEWRSREVVDENCDPPVDPFLNDTRWCNTHCCVSDWTGWSACDEPCGGGHTYRTRTITAAAVQGGACPEASNLEEVDDCNEDPCPIDCEVGNWSDWSTCTAECGTGQQWRNRTVLVDPEYEGAPCPSTNETRNCNTHPCPIDCEVSEWTAWSACNQTCGNGTQTRTRTIAVHPQYGGEACPPLTDWQPCNEICCIDDWSEWSACNQTCGNGTQWRDRSVIEENCTPPEDPELYQWQPCSETCCLSDWSEFSACNQTCGNGTQWRDRYVIEEFCTPPVDPVLYEWQPCSETCCLSEWSTWSSCDLECGNGTQWRDRSVIEDNCTPPDDPVLYETQRCNEICCLSDWSEWSACNQTCGNGTQWRDKEVIEEHCTPPDDPVLYQWQPCSETCCYSDWNEWNPCDRECGNGTQWRDRTVVEENCTPPSEPILNDTQICNTECCLSEWPEWSECSHTCGNGSQWREREVVNVNCEPPEDPILYEVQRCNEECCLSDWGEWSACNQTCGNGTQWRDREVIEEHCTPPVDPVLYDWQPCNETCCISEWSDWSTCTVVCGGGLQWHNRSVIEDNCTPPEEPVLNETQACNEQCCPVDCHVGAWGQWTECNATCGGGWQIRFRNVTTEQFCGGEECPNLNNTRECNTHCCQVNCTVSDWGEWQPCNQTCGTGYIWREKTFIVEASCGGFCPEASNMVEAYTCNTHHCPVNCTVGSWSSFGHDNDCTSFCGNGTWYRTRPVVTPAAYGGYDCPPLREYELCSTEECPHCETPEAIHEDCTFWCWNDHNQCVFLCADSQDEENALACAEGCDEVHDECVSECDNAEPCNGCIMGNWTEWSECTPACGSTRHRTRFMNITETGEEGLCPEGITQYEECETVSCPFNCTVGQWSGWSTCNQTCNGTQYRTRDVTAYDTHGGADCPPLIDYQTCSDMTVCPRHCIVTDWTGWLPCSVECGGGIQFNYRNITQTSIPPGNACPESLIHERACNTHQCPVNCQVGEWSAWSICAKQIGSMQLCALNHSDTEGVRIATRYVIVTPQYDGTPCPALNQTDECILPLCPPPEPLPTDVGCYPDCPPPPVDSADSSDPQESSSSEDESDVVVDVDNSAFSGLPPLWIIISSSAAALIAAGIIFKTIRKHVDIPRYPQMDNDEFDEPFIVQEDGARFELPPTTPFTL